MNNRFKSISIVLFTMLMVTAYPVGAVTKLGDTDTGITTYISGGHVFTISSDVATNSKARTAMASGFTGGKEFGNFTNAKSVESVSYRTFVLDGTDLWVAGYGYPVLTKIATGVNDFGASFLDVSILKTDGSVQTIKLIAANKGQLVTGAPITVSVSGTGVISLCGGAYHQAALTDTGNVFVIGTVNTDGRLGLGTTTTVTAWTQVKVSNIIAIDCGDTATILLTKTGDVLASGAGIFGTGVNTLSFQSLKMSGVSYASVGNGVVFMVKGNELYTQGWHNLIYNGLNRYSYTPVKVPGFTGVTAVQSCGSHVLVIQNDGYTYSWGQDNLGQLGYSIAPLAETNAPKGFNLLTLPATTVVTSTMVVETPVLTPVVSVTTETVNELVAISTTWVEPTTKVRTIIDPVAMTTITTDDVQKVQTTAPIVSEVETETKPIVRVTTSEELECIAHNNGQNKEGNRIDYCKKGFINQQKKNN